MVNKPLIRPAISGGGTWPGGGWLTIAINLEKFSMEPWSTWTEPGYTDCNTNFKVT